METRRSVAGGKTGGKSIPKSIAKERETEMQNKRKQRNPRDEEGKSRVERIACGECCQEP